MHLETETPTPTSTLSDRARHAVLGLPVAVISTVHTAPALADWGGVGTAITSTTDGILDNAFSPIAILAVVVVMITAFFSRGLALIAFFLILGATAVAFNADGIIEIVSGGSGGG